MHQSSWKSRRHRRRGHRHNAWFRQHGSNERQVLLPGVFLARPARSHTRNSLRVSAKCSIWGGGGGGDQSTHLTRSHGGGSAVDQPICHTLSSEEMATLIFLFRVTMTCGQGPSHRLKHCLVLLRSCFSIFWTFFLSLPFSALKIAFLET